MIRHLAPGSLSSNDWHGRVLPADLAAETYASATDMENQGTATNTSLLMSPGMMRHHPGFPKAWVKFTATAGVTAAYNVGTATGVTRTASGQFTVNFVTHFSATGNYCALANVEGENDNVGVIDSYASNGVVVLCWDMGAAARDDTNMNFMNVVCFGDQ